MLRLLTSTLLALAIPAQDRLLVDQDLVPRAQAAELLQQAARDASGLEPAAALSRLMAAADAAVRMLPAQSRSQARLAAALAAAADGQQPGSRRLPALRSEIGDLVADLTFRPVQEAQLPAGFPGFRAVDEIELRDYPAYRMVRASLRSGDVGSFWLLFRHIEANGIAMTTPVQMDWQQPDATRAATMAFLYGDPDIGRTGKQGQVEVVDVPAARVLSIGARGYDRRSRVEELHEALSQWLRANPGFRAAGPMRTMGYNSPSVRDERRYFEVQLPVERDPAGSL